jgi:eukaryotic-like serine/threonine-protein kinase
LSLIGKNIGNYRITAKLGEGGMGAVYLGEHPLIGKRVAVKVLLEELSSKEDIVQRFFNEAKAVNDIGHPNIVDIVDFGRAADDSGKPVVYFIMEYLDGEALSTRMRRVGLTFPETLHVIAQCCSALAASHRKGIVHRDLKPDNIYLVNRGADRNFAKLLDFGIAKLTGDGGNSHKTRTGLVIGTPWYMSPEQCEGKGLIDHRSDVYSLGVVMYELITGRVPFPGEGFGEVLIAQMTQLARPPSHLNPQITPELEQIVMRALEKDKAARYQSMDEFMKAIELQGGYAPSPSGAWTPAPTAVLGPPTKTTLSGAASEKMGGRGRSSSRGVAFALLGLAVLGGGGLFAYKALSKPSTAAAQPETPQPETPKPEPPKPDPDEAKQISVHIVSDPDGAKVFRADGKFLGETPLDIMARAGEPSFDIEIRLDGYKAQRREITPKKDLELVVQFVKEVVPQPEPPATRPKPVVASKTSSKTSKKSSSKPAATPKKKDESEFKIYRPKVFD